MQPNKVQVEHVMKVCLHEFRNDFVNLDFDRIVQLDSCATMVAKLVAKQVAHKAYLSCDKPLGSGYT